MRPIYRRATATASRLINGPFKQEGFAGITEVLTPNPDPKYPPTIVRTLTPFAAVARGVSQDMAFSDPNLNRTDIQILMDNTQGFTPEVGGHVSVNGVDRAIIRVDNIPALGVPCAYRFFVR